MIDDDFDKMEKAVFSVGAIFVILGTLISLAGSVVIIWAIFKLVQHLTAG